MLGVFGVGVGGGQGDASAFVNADGFRPRSGHDLYFNRFAKDNPFTILGVGFDADPCLSANLDSE